MAKNAEMSRRSFLKWLTSAGVAAAVGTSIYSYYVERRQIVINTVQISMFKNRENHPFRGTRIVHFSDVHFGFHFNKKALAGVISQIERLNPDLICFTGDLVDDGNEGLEDCLQLFRDLAPPLGIFAVLGNHDYTKDGINSVGDFWEKSHVELLVNQQHTIERGGEKIHIAGIDDVINGSVDLKQALQGTTEEDDVILLAHEPDFADIVSLFPQVKLQLSGHSHGGQIRLPFIGHLVVPPLGRKYVDGYYKVGSGDLHLYTNRGIGTSRLPIRFWCRPEITVLELV